jgi:polyhydroxyalkanoate synthesis regulator phasin
MAMNRDETLKRYQEAGAEFLDAARAKAEGFLRDATSAGEATQERATSAVDELLGSGRRGTEQLLDAIRREITTQLKALGVAKIVDLEALERRLGLFGSKPDKSIT